MNLEPQPLTAGCSCADCPYSKNKEPARPVLASGLRRLDKCVGVIVGESPGTEEVHVGRPFMGQTGRELDGVLQEAGIDRSSLVIVNAIACKPREPKEDRDMETATWACRPYVKRIFELVSQLAPNRSKTPILILGKWAWFSITGTGGYINERGFVQDRVSCRTIGAVDARAIPRDEFGLE